jgi:hypothetical protein
VRVRVCLGRTAPKCPRSVVRMTLAPGRSAAAMTDASTNPRAKSAYFAHQRCRTRHIVRLQRLDRELVFGESDDERFFGVGPDARLEG